MWKNYENWIYNHMNLTILLISPFGVFFTFFLAGDKGMMPFRIEFILYVIGLLLLIGWIIPAAIVQLFRRKLYLKGHYKRKWFYIKYEVMNVYWITLLIVQPILSLCFFKVVFSRFICWLLYFFVWLGRGCAVASNYEYKKKYLSQEDMIRQFLQSGKNLEIIAITLDEKTTLAKSELEVKESRPFFLTDSKLKKKYREFIPIECCLIQPESQRELDEILPVLYEESLGQMPDRLGRVFVAARRKTLGMPSFDLPECLDGLLGVRYFEYDHDSIFKGEEFWKRFYKSDAGGVSPFYFRCPCRIYELLPKDISEQFKHKFRNNQIYEFLHNAFVMDQPFQSVMALLDYGELILRCCAYSLFLKNSVSIHDYIEGTPRCAYRYNKRLEDIEVLIKADIQTLAEMISAGVMQEVEIFSDINSLLFDVEEVLKITVFQPLEELLEVEFQEEQFDFIGLCSVIRYVRNRIKAHGSIQDKNLGCIWTFLAYGMLVLSIYLKIWNFDIYDKDDELWCGYPGMEVNARPFFDKKGNSFCVLHNMKITREKRTYEYINYFEGEMIVPVIH